MVYKHSKWAKKKTPQKQQQAPNPQPPNNRPKRSMHSSRVSKQLYSTYWNPKLSLENSQKAPYNLENRVPKGGREAGNPALSI
jgi:hypothetical protein